MTQETRPTAKELLASWQLIWHRKLTGTPAEIKDAIASHVQLFPKGNHAETQARTQRIIGSYSGDPKAIKALLNRSQATLRTR